MNLFTGTGIFVESVITELGVLSEFRRGPTKRGFSSVKCRKKAGRFSQIATRKAVVRGIWIIPCVQCHPGRGNKRLYFTCTYLGVFCAFCGFATTVHCAMCVYLICVQSFQVLNRPSSDIKKGSVHATA